MMINAGKYNKKINIYILVDAKDKDGFRKEMKKAVFSPYARVKTTKGYTIIANNSDFEKAYTNFTIRYSQKVVDAYYESVDSNREMIVEYNKKSYIVQYLNNIDETNVEIEMQCKEVKK